jgi:hypothetical protein
MNADRPEKVEDQLRRRLRPVKAPEGFADRLMAALPPVQAPKVAVLIPRAARPSMRQFGMPAALAASLMISVFLGVYVANLRMHREEQLGIAASQELMQALRVTSQKLDLAYEAVNNPPAAGDEENRS